MNVCFLRRGRGWGERDLDSREWNTTCFNEEEELEKSNLLLSFQKNVIIVLRTSTIYQVKLL